MKLKDYRPAKDEIVVVRSESTNTIGIGHWWGEEFSWAGIANGLLTGRLDDSCASDFEPLLTASEWQARHPTLRKLAKGEPRKAGHSYLVRQAGGWERQLERPSVDTADNDLVWCEHYELPPLPPAEIEPVFCSACGLDASGPSVHKCPIATPAPSPVGERLTEPPEVGTWVVDFHEDGWLEFYRWEEKHKIYPHIYRWRGEIPTEPAPEKVEPPKFVHELVFRWTCPRCQEESVEPLTSPNRYYCPDCGECVKMPPSPELAALFAGEGEQ